MHISAPSNTQSEYFFLFFQSEFKYLATVSPHPTFCFAMICDLDFLEVAKATSPKY